MPVKLIDINGAAIRAARYARGFTLADLAKRVDSTRTHIGNIERGSKGASPQLLSRIAIALDVNPRTLVTANVRQAA